MSEKDEEALSALMDGELDEFETRRLLRDMPDNKSLLERWDRYHISRTVMRGEHAQPGQTFAASMTLSSRVMAAIEDEPVPAADKSAEITAAQTQRTQARPGMLKPFASVAVAASVCFAVVVGYQQMNPSQSGVAPAGLALANNAVDVMDAPVSGSMSVNADSGNATLTVINPPTLRQKVIPVVDGYGSQSRSVITGDIIRHIPDDDEMFNPYFISHTGKNAVHSSQGVMPFARMVTLEAPQSQSSAGE